MGLENGPTPGNYFMQYVIGMCLFPHCSGSFLNFFLVLFSLKLTLEGDGKRERERERERER